MSLSQLEMVFVIHTYLEDDDTHWQIFRALFSLPAYQNISLLGLFPYWEWCSFEFGVTTIEYLLPYPIIFDQLDFGFGPLLQILFTQHTWGSFLLLHHISVCGNGVAVLLFKKKQKTYWKAMIYSNFYLDFQDNY